ncbi:hypothetical protein B0T14DRAFT_518609 [Immersiella caudata]|uniref:T6SS Phospholipase effector Tle1-like catalytic domain-containing protein n=1 Tax=Immersiella caudata TaxID=314043 RepID=A0AA40BYY2_9PEZI|nr:hypothetical protein B0T14DRAFT_518609 [Immersiella caudata]
MSTHRHPGDQFRRDRAKAIRKRLFVLCDGTWQDGVNKTQPLTNVATLARCIAPIDEDGCLQVIYYDGGVGNSTGYWSQRIDGATGRGISAKIRNAYSFLAHNYNFEKRVSGDEIVLAGFSRGAFTVQCLASFISDTGGLLAMQHLYYLRGLFTLWSYKNVPGGEAKFKEERKRLEDAKLIHKVSITACAVWDTVSALGTGFQLRPHPLSFVGTRVPSRVQNAFHALALDEKRGNFSPVVWEEGQADSGTRISQCWFLGSHSDVGGSGDAALGSITLLWMIGKLRDHVGVVFDEFEIAKHLKHKFLEWDFTVSRWRKALEETRTLSTREHSGQPTLPSWHWGVMGLGWRPRERYLRDSQSLPSDIHFTVRLALAEGGISSQILKSWTAAWTTEDPTNTATTPRYIEWRAPRKTLQIVGDSSDVALREHPLKMRNGRCEYEYDLLIRWSQDNLQAGPTDRTPFAERRLQELEDVVQKGGTDNALTALAELLEQHMKFSDDGRLAVDVIYPQLATEINTTRQ